MLTYQEQIELREKLVKDEISIQYAKEFYWKDFKEGNRVWHTKDWKERRKKVIKEKCEICSSQNTLTIQHLSHPLKYYDYENAVSQEYTKQSIESNTYFDKKEFKKYVLKNHSYLPIPLCPQCNHRKPNYRIRKIPKYLCTNCQHQFDKPNHKTIAELLVIMYENGAAIEVRDKCFVSKDQWKNQNNLLGLKYWFQRNKIQLNYSNKIEKEAFMRYLDANIKYLSFEDTITACKKCAASYDLFNMELCPNCKEYYKGIKFETCIPCLPQDKRKIALEKVEFGNDWREMEKELGID